MHATPCLATRIAMIIFLRRIPPSSAHPAPQSSASPGPAHRPRDGSGRRCWRTRIHGRAYISPGFAPIFGHRHIKPALVLPVGLQVAQCIPRSITQFATHFIRYYLFRRSGLAPLRALAATETFGLARGAQLLQHPPDQIDAYPRTFFLQIGNSERPGLAVDCRQNQLGLCAPGRSHLADSFLELPIGGLEYIEQITDIGPWIVPAFVPAPGALGQRFVVAKQGYAG